jgi:hypothetical protein
MITTPPSLSVTNRVGLALIPAIAQATCSFFLLPESPRWLLKHKSRASALRALSRLRGVKSSSNQPVPSHIEEELESMVEQKQDANKTGGWSALREPKIFRLVVICSILQVTTNRFHILCVD